MIALFSVAVFRTVLSTGQWLSIGVVTMGLMLSISSVETGSSEGNAFLPRYYLRDILL